MEIKGVRVQVKVDGDPLLEYDIRGEHKATCFVASEIGKVCSTMYRCAHVFHKPILCSNLCYAQRIIRTTMRLSVGSTSMVCAATSARSIRAGAARQRVCIWMGTLSALTSFHPCD